MPFRHSWNSLIAGVFLAFAASTSLGEELLTPDTPIEQAIDFYIDARLAEAGVSPAQAADDANLLRRTMLDLAGRPATAIEAQEYVAVDDGNKRLALAERLLASPEFARHQASELATLLGGDEALEPYLLKAVSENRPWSQMFRELVVGEEGDEKQEGAIRFVRRRAGDLDKLAHDASIIFFGVNVSCAKCHDHPLVPDWSQDHYYGLYSFFSRTFENGGFIGEREYGKVDYVTTAGEARSSRPMFLTGYFPDEPMVSEPSEEERQKEKELLEELRKNLAPPPAPAFSRRRLLVETALAGEQREFFARAMVNHQWKRFFGRGLVHPSDQLHSANQPSHPELLAWLARDFANHNYDLRRLTRGIVLSAAYGRSSRWQDGAGDRERPDPNLFAVAEPRPLGPKAYAATLAIAGANPDRFQSPEQREARIGETMAGSREMASRFDPLKDDFQVGAGEALMMSNSERFQQWLVAEGESSLATKIAGLSDARLVAEMASWNVFGRPCEENEFAAIDDFWSKNADNRTAAAKQLVWAMLASSECRFNF